MWKVIRRGVFAHKLRFLLTALAVFISVAFISGVFVFSATLERTFTDLFADIYRGTDAVVRAPKAFSSDFGGGGRRPPVDESVMPLLRSAPGVADVEGNVQLDYAQPIDKDNQPIGNPGNGAPAFGGNWITNETLNPFKIYKGAPPASDNEVVLDKRTADRGNIVVGDRVRILTTAAPEEYTVSGIAKFGTADSPAGASFALFTTPRVQRLANKVGKFDEIEVEAAPGVSQDELVANLRATVASSNQGVVEVVSGEEITKENQNAIKKQLRFLSVALFVFALVALFVALFIIYNTFTITVAQRSREMALLRAIGASRRQVFAQVVGEALVIGVVASVVGAAGGVVIAMGLRGLFGTIGWDFPTDTLIVPPSGLAIGVVVGILMTLLMATIPARRASRIPPVAAMRDVALERPLNRAVRLGVGGGLVLLGLVSMVAGLFVDEIKLVGGALPLVFIGVVVLGPLFSRGVARTLGAPLPRLKGMTGTIARENATRNPRRTSTSALALVISVMLVGFITIFAASAKASIAQVIDQQTEVDYFVTSGTGFGGGSGLSPDLTRQVAQLPEMEAVTPLRFSPLSPQVGIAGQTEFIIGLDPRGAEAMLQFGSVDGSWLDLAPGGLAVSKDAATKNNWKRGDIVPVQFLDTGIQPLRIDYIYEKNLFANYAVSTDTFDANFRQGLDFQILAKLRPGVTPEEARAALEPLLAPYPTAKIKDNAQYKADQAARINQFVTLIYGMLALAIIIGFIGIVITLFLSIYERTHEIGLLRAVGMTRSQIRSAVRWESVIISVFGSVVGLAIGLVFGWAVVQSLRSEGFEKFAAAPLQLVAVVVIAAILGVGAAFFPARRAAKLDVLEAISTE